VNTQVVQTPLRLASAAECVRFERESFGALQQMLSALPDAEQASAWDEIEQELRAFQGVAGFAAEAELVVGAGVK
jgi:hypothetical protein